MLNMLKQDACGFPHNHPTYMCCFRELHCKTVTLCVNVLNFFLFCILTVQTLLANEKHFFDFYCILAQGTVICFTFFALYNDKTLFYIPSIVYWIIVSLMIFLLIVCSFVYALDPTKFASGETNSLPNMEKLPMIKGVAAMGTWMLTVLLLVCVWFTETTIRTLLYAKQINRFRKSLSITHVHGNITCFGLNSQLD